MRTLLLSGALVVSVPVCAQTVSPLTVAAPVDTSTLATKADLADIQASTPKPADTTPPSEMVGGQTGSQIRYAREDHTHPRITRAGTATTDGSGNWTITWSTPTATTPVVLPIPIDGGIQPVMCTVATRTTTGATGKCFRSQLLPTTLLLLSSLVNFNVLGGLVSGVTVQILAIPPTQ